MDITRYTTVSTVPRAVDWLTFEENRGLATNTLNAYARALEDFFKFCAVQGISIIEAGRDHIGRYIRDLKVRPLPPQVTRGEYKQAHGLTNSTINQRLTAIRRFYDYLEEDGIIERNPVRRGRYAHGSSYSGERGLVPTYQDFPWIPDLDQWRRIMCQLQTFGLRDKLLFALSYDGALRREEVCSLHITDIDVAYRLVRIRAETTKSRRARTVSYTEITEALLRQYLRVRAGVSRQPGALFLSVSPRNYGQPIVSAIWSKTVKKLSQLAEVPLFTPHTLRHLRLTDLARAGVDLHDIATFAGHRSIDTTMQYIHLSGTELAERISARLDTLHAERLDTLEEPHDD
jgi:integrase/recombinase XerD